MSLTTCNWEAEAQDRRAASVSRSCRCVPCSSSGTGARVPLRLVDPPPPHVPVPPRGDIIREPPVVPKAPPVAWPAVRSAPDHRRAANGAATSHTQGGSIESSHGHHLRLGPG